MIAQITCVLSGIYLATSLVQSSEPFSSAEAESNQTTCESVQLRQPTEAIGGGVTLHWLRRASPDAIGLGRCQQLSVRTNMHRVSTHTHEWMDAWMEACMSERIKNDDNERLREGSLSEEITWLPVCAIILW